MTQWKPGTSTETREALDALKWLLETVENPDIPAPRFAIDNARALVERSLLPPLRLEIISDSGRIPIVGRTFISQRLVCPFPIFLDKGAMTNCFVKVGEEPPAPDSTYITLQDCILHDCDVLAPYITDEHP